MIPTFTALLIIVVWLIHISSIKLTPGETRRTRTLWCLVLVLSAGWAITDILPLFVSLSFNAKVALYRIGIALSGISMGIMIALLVLKIESVPVKFSSKFFCRKNK